MGFNLEKFVGQLQEHGTEKTLANFTWGLLNSVVKKTNEAHRAAHQRAKEQGKIIDAEIVDPKIVK